MNMVKYFLLFCLMIAWSASRCETSIQGRLFDQGEETSGHYDFEVRFYSAASDGSELQPSQQFANSDVIDGSFRLQIESPTSSTTWMQIGVRIAGESEYVILAPRVRRAPMPKAVSAGVATLAAGVRNGALDGTAIAVGALSTADADLAELQRHPASCSGTTAIRAISQDGTVICQASLQGPQGPQGQPGVPPNPFAVCTSRDSFNPECNCAKKLVDIEAVTVGSRCAVRTTGGTCGFDRSSTNRRGGRCCVCVP